MIGLIFATQREAEPLRRLTSGMGGSRLPARVCPASDDRNAPCPTWLFRADGEQIAAAICGIGKAAAAAGVQYLLERLRVTAIINAGICGAADDSVTVGAVYRVGEVCDADAPALAALDCPAGRWSHLPPVRLVTSGEPVFETNRRLEISRMGSVVDMEGYAIADACRRASVPCCLLKGVTDLADEAGRASMENNIDHVSARVADVLIRGLEHKMERIDRIDEDDRIF